MQHVRFGRTGLRVSRLCLGTMTFGHQCDEETSFAIMDTAAEAGIDFFDTADMYPLGGPPESFGRTEEIVGKWLKGRRDDYLVATKCFFPTGRRAWESGSSRHNIMRSIDLSLKRLGTDHVDLYQVHSWDTGTRIDETLLALEDVVKSGKARYVGCSNLLAYQLARSLGRAEALRVTGFECVQPRYNMLFRENEREMFPLCAEDGIAVIPYNPLAGGFLTGKHRPEAPIDGGRFTLGAGTAERYRDRYWHDRMFATVDALRPIAAEAGVTLATLAVQWVLANPVVTAPIVGASRPEQLADVIAATRTSIDPEVKFRVDELTHEYRFGDAAR